VESARHPPAVRPFVAFPSLGTAWLVPEQACLLARVISVS
jgi:hypothetical protein